MKEESPSYYVSTKYTYDIIKKAHMATGHNGCNRVMKHLSSKYANTTRDAVEHLKSFCVVCQEKRRHHLNDLLAVLL